MSHHIVPGSVYHPFMSSPSEPSVESMTAEIRVLKVGSKQVTLSAARQLDHVDASDITPFGRVKIATKDAAGLIEVIGSDPDGVLSRSSARARKALCVGYKTSPIHDAFGLLTETCGQHHDISPDFTPADQHRWVKYTPSMDVYEAWLDLPLIVLAGLR
jgi:hypothetical protein